MKRQMELVRRLKGKLSPRVRISFAVAGTEPDEAALRRETDGKAGSECLGYRTDIYDLLRNHDFVLLFSEHEGLPISLIETAMTGMPAVCNDVGGNAEIIRNGKTASLWTRTTGMGCRGERSCGGFLPVRASLLPVSDGKIAAWPYRVTYAVHA